MLAALALAAAQDGAFDFAPKPQYGHWDYRMHRLVLHFPGRKTEYAMRARQRVVKIHPDDTYEVLFETRRSVVIQGGKQAETPFRKERTMTYRKGGWIQPSFLPGETGATEASLLTGFRAPPEPVRVGQSWSFAATGEPGFAVTFTLVGPETVDRVDCLKVRSEARLVGTERAATATGHFWVNQGNGAVWMSSHKLAGIRMGGREIDMNLVFEPTDAAMFEGGK